MRRPFFLALALALASPALASAEAPGAGALAGGLFSMPIAAEKLAAPSPGTWVEYVATLDGKPVGSYLRFVYAGRNEEGVWLELWLSSRPGSAATSFRLLLEADGSGGLRPKRAWQRLLGGKAAEVKLPDESGARDPAAQRQVGEPEKTTVMTRAGTFSARSLSVRQGGRVAARLFLADRLPIFGLARMDLEGKRGLEVHAFGEGSPLVFGAP